VTVRPDGFLNLNKPVGISSHGCIGALRRQLGVKKVGHGGTLDPAASGVLPVAVGRATRLLPYLPADKAYRAVVRFGITTTTDDLEGEVIAQTPAAHLDRAGVMAQLPAFLGTLRQVPPAYSAIQVNGQRLYQRARQGLPVAVPERQVTVHAIDLVGWQGGSDWPEATLTIACGPGTYIRAIARDLGTKLGTGATLAQLVRTRSGGFDLATSRPLTEMETEAAQGTLALVSPGDALTHLPAISLEAALAHRWQLGQKLAWTGDQPAEQPHRILNLAGDFLGVGRVQATEAGLVLRAAMVYQLPT